MEYNKTRYTSPKNLFSAQELKMSGGVYHITRVGSAAPSISYNADSNKLDINGLSSITPESLNDLIDLAKALYEKN